MYTSSCASLRHLVGLLLNQATKPQNIKAAFSLSSMSSKPAVVPSRQTEMPLPVINPAAAGPKLYWSPSTVLFWTGEVCDSKCLYHGAISTGSGEVMTSVGEWSSSRFTVH